MKLFSSLCRLNRPKLPCRFYARKKILNPTEDGLDPDEELSEFLRLYADRHKLTQSQLSQQIDNVTSRKGRPFSLCDLPFLTSNLGLIPPQVGEYWKPPKVDFTPSKRFLSLMEEIPRVWGLQTEKGRRTVIDMFLIEVLTSKKTADDAYPFKVWCEHNISTKKVQGYLDYLAGPQSLYPVPSHILALEAKPYWPEDGYCQLLAEMAALLELNRKANLTDSLLPVYGILSNESDWQFFKLEADLRWLQSMKYIKERDTTEILGIMSAMFEQQELRKE